MTQPLRSGYTTGTHATATLIACLCEYYEKKIVETLEVLLPKEKVASIDVLQEKELCFSSIKGDNDDIDVTKGAKIFCDLHLEAPQDLKEQTPSQLNLNKTLLYVWAGEGVGVVTKKGLKITPNHPAINPVPLEMMGENTLDIVKENSDILHAIFSVEDGENIARDTANAKVGVLGGISILGTRGIVKPVSASAYIDSIETEIDVAAALSEDVIVFTLGNTAIDFAKELYDETNIVEIGNFVYDASERLQKHHFEKMVFITSVAKMTKVAQGFKNTHNKFGTIDFEEVRAWLLNELNYTLAKEEYISLKGVIEVLPKELQENFVRLLSKKSAKMFQKWFTDLGIITNKIEIITLPNKIKEEHAW